MKQNPVTRQIPQVDKVLRHPMLEDLKQHIRREVLVTLTRQELNACRSSLGSGRQVPDIDSVAQAVVGKLQKLTSPSLKKVINGTGVVLNTNLGRAPLPAIALKQLNEVGSGYTSLEIDLGSGRRGQRGSKIVELLQVLTGCQSALVVNNNAAAILLVVNTVSKNREVLVSRGELIEIGGSFRLPEVIEAAGAILHEVGTTNRTRLEDYSRAISSQSGLLLKCHRSNFTISGFTEDAALSELVALAKKSQIPMIYDLGSGVLIELAKCGVTEEPTIESTLANGCALVTFSADKLLGGPQAGIIVGDKPLVELLHQNPLYRALRVDKLTLAALEGVLTSYLSCEPENPTLKMLSTPSSELKQRCEHFKSQASPLLKKLTLTVMPTKSTVGGGSLPGKTLDSFAIAIAGGKPPDNLGKSLRTAPNPVISVIKDNLVTIDFRTVLLDEEKLLLATLVFADKLLGN